MTRASRIVEELRREKLLTSGPAVLPDLTMVTDDSRAVQPEGLFVAVRGVATDGHRYVHDAVTRGVALVVVEQVIDVDVPQIVVTDSRVAVSVIARAWHGNPGRGLQLVGITGTNGKSTTAFLLQHLLTANQSVGVIGTLGAFDTEGNALYRERLTTPGPFALHETLRAFVDRGYDGAVMEVSSHALSQRRVHGLGFQAAVFTNVSHDHLDYHGSVSAYRRAKMQLANHVVRDGVRVINEDEPVWTALRHTDEHAVVTFGFGAGATVRGERLVSAPDGLRMQVVCGAESYEVFSPLVGRFNAENLLAALATGFALGHPLHEMVDRARSVPPVPGRMERVHDQPSVIRDYAHTPDALKRCLTAVRESMDGRIIVVFGCGGDRDRDKRAPMGAIAAELADVIIATSDNPRTEDPDAILDDIAEGLRGHAYLRIVNRKDAIARALQMAESNDCVVLAGKGHETYQEIAGQRFDFDEAEIVRAVAEGLTS